MSALRSGSFLQTLVLTPDRIPDFLVPPRSPLRLLSPRFHRRSPLRTRLLSDHDDGPDGTPPGDQPGGGVRLLVPSLRVRGQRRSDTDASTRAAMSLPHVEKVTTPYGFHAVLAETPSMHQGEALFHNPLALNSVDPPVPPGPRRSPASRLRPVKALCLQVKEELKKPAAALKALSPAHRRTRLT
ncbi:C2 calcium-dependent domain-containing protein 4A-like [Antennarius striatus]|uniref:C2 calcium-dependent domain-containing protein 4A-like n=1 Tax=Antennarius striatus TaxID=241820 RepID=UPI0035B3459B